MVELDARRYAQNIYGVTMKISELLREDDAAKPKAPKPGASRLPHAASIDDEPQDDGEDGDSEDRDVPVNAEREFKQDAVSVGDGIYALSAWVYPDAWTGNGYSDMLMHRITTLADELDADIGDYAGIDDQTIERDRGLEVVFYNSHTQMMFRLSASASQGSVEFTPTLMDLQQSGMITNAQLPKLKNIERTVQTWCDAVPERTAVRGARGRPNTPQWRRSESAVTKLFSFVDPGVGGDDEMYDPESSSFWEKTSFREPSPENKKAGDDYIAALLAQIDKEDAEAKKKSGPGRDKRK
jgi:hypothetical protein